MAQQIQGYGKSPYAEEALRLAEIGQGQGGMARTTAPVGPNLQDSGGASKPSVNTQPFNNARLKQQNIAENIRTKVPGDQAKAISDLRQANAAEADAMTSEQRFLNQRVAEFLYANDAGTATFGLAMPEVADRVKGHVAQQKLMAFGINPAQPFTSGNLPA